MPWPINRISYLGGNWLLGELLGLKSVHRAEFCAWDESLSIDCGGLDGEEALRAIDKQQKGP